MQYPISVFIDAWADYVSKAPYIEDAFEFVQSGYTKNDFLSLSKYLQRMAKKYTGLAYEICFSETDSHGTCYKIAEKSGKLCKPKTKVVGDKITPHVHGTVISIILGADIETAYKDIGKYLTKKCNKSKSVKRHKRSKIKPRFEMQNISDSVGCHCKYAHRQAESIHRGGEFYDWEYFDDERFFIPYDDE